MQGQCHKATVIKISNITCRLIITFRFCIIQSTRIFATIVIISFLCVNCNFFSSFYLCYNVTIQLFYYVYVYYFFSYSLSLLLYTFSFRHGGRTVIVV